MLALALVGCGDEPAGSAGGTGSSGSSTGDAPATQTGAPTTGASAATTGDGTSGGASGMSETTDTPTTGPVTGGSTSVTGGAGTTSGDTGDTGGTTSATSTTGTTSTGDSGDGGPGSSGSDDGSSGPISGSSSEGSSSTGDGGCKAPADCPQPGECLVATCEQGVCGQAPEPMGVMCSDGQCDGSGSCVECLADADCASLVCEAGACAAPACDDGVLNGDESDVDCGGSCEGCALGEGCGGPGDCLSDTCSAGVCVAPGPLCAQGPADPVTGQRCPLFMKCAESVECGDFVGCQQWFCNNAKTCELNAKVACWQDKGGACNADVVFTQQTAPPVDKRFVPPDNVDFREVASLAFTIKNNSAGDLYLDRLPLQLDVLGGGSKFDVSSVKIFDNSGGTEHGPGDILVCLTANPFSFPANGIMGPCAGSAFAKIPKGQSNQFIVNVAFAKEKTFIAGRSYRLNLTSTAGVELKVGFNGPLFAGSMCGVPPGGYVGAWVTAQNP